MTHKYTFSFLSITSDKEKCFDQLPDIPALHRTSQGRCRTSQVPDIPGDISRQVPDIPGAGHPGLAPDISRQVPDISRQVQDIPALHQTSQGRCRTSQVLVPDIPALRRTSQGRCRTSQVPDILGAGHPGLAPDISRQVPDISRQVPDIPAKRWTS